MGLVDLVAGHPPGTPHAEALAHAPHGRLIREGLQVAIAGRPNAGKSSLFNRLAGVGRAIVAEGPGTTRDLLTERIDIDGIPMTFIDTAGDHAGARDPVEVEGIARAHSARRVAEVVMVVLDRSRPLDGDDRRLLRETTAGSRVVVANKSDLPPAWALEDVEAADIVSVSATTGDGLDRLRRALATSKTGESLRDGPSITNVRHADLLRRAHAALERAAAAARQQTPEEFVLADLNEARSVLEEVTGRRTSDDVLHAIFDRFCIGK
jgi:tRNA modification GTPase